MLTARRETKELSTTACKDDTLELELFLYWMKRAGVKFLKVYDGECSGNLILILGLEIENILF